MWRKRTSYNGKPGGKSADGAGGSGVTLFIGHTPWARLCAWPQGHRRHCLAGLRELLVVEAVMQTHRICIFPCDIMSILSFPFISVPF